MACSSESDVNVFIQLTDSPAGRRYWVEEKRTIIFNVFKTEIFNDSLPIPADKMREAITQLGETQNFRTHNRIRTFLYRIRKQRLNKSRFSGLSDAECDSPSLSEEDRRERLRKYWTKDKRRVVYKVLKKEILDLNTAIPADKILKVIDQIGENPTKRNIARLRKFVGSVRKQRMQREKEKKPVTPLPSDSESADEDTDTKSDDATQSSNADGENSGKTSQDESEIKQNDEDSGNGNGLESNHCQDEPDSKGDTDSLNGNESSENVSEETTANPSPATAEESTESSENADLRKLENCLEESELDAAARSFGENSTNDEKQIESTSENTEAETIREPGSVEVAESSTESDILESAERISECVEEETKCDSAKQPLNENGDDIGNHLEDTLETGKERTIDIDIQSSKNENGTTFENEIKADSENNTAKLPQTIQKTLDSQDLSEASLQNDFDDMQTSSEDDTISEILKKLLSRNMDSNESLFENGTQEAKVDPAVQSSDGNEDDSGVKIKPSVSPKRKMESGDSNEALISPKRKKTQWTSEMTSVLKNHFARELSQSNWPTEPGKVDFVTNFLKSNGFHNITSETVFTWADNHFKKQNDNSESFSDQITGYLVAGVINGSIGLDSVSKLNPEQNKLPECSPEAPETDEPFSVSDIPLPPGVPIDQDFSNETGNNESAQKNQDDPALNGEVAL